MNTKQDLNKFLLIFSKIFLYFYNTRIIFHKQHTTTQHTKNLYLNQIKKKENHNKKKPKKNQTKIKKKTKEAYPQKQTPQHSS